MCTTSLFFLVFFRSSPSFFSLFLLLYFFFLFMPFFFLLFFSFSLLFSRSSCFLFSFLSLLVYRTRAHAHARVLGFDTHGRVVKKAFRCAIVETLFLFVLFCGYQSRRPRSALLAVCLVPGFCVFSLFVFVSVTPRPMPRFPSFIFLMSGVVHRFAFFRFLLPLNAIFLSRSSILSTATFLRPFSGLFFKLMTVSDKKCYFRPLSI